MPRHKRDEKTRRRGDTRKILMEVGWLQDPRFQPRSADAKLVYWALWDRGRHEMREILPSYYNAKFLTIFIGGDMTEKRCQAALDDLMSDNPIPLVTIENGQIQISGLKSIHSALEAWKDETDDESFPIDSKRLGTGQDRTGQDRTLSKATLSTSMQEFLHFYVTEVSKPTGLPCPKELTDARKRHLKARFRESSFERDKWPVIAKKIVHSRFLRGEAGNESWKGATFDWLIKSPSNVVKILEGNYDDAGSGKRYEEIM